MPKLRISGGNIFFNEELVALFVDSNYAQRLAFEKWLKEKDAEKRLFDLSHDDIGKWVNYVPKHGPKERGIITSFNDTGVFVCYGSGSVSKLTSRRDLEWA
jgi:hypothetical protein